jgi:hypothetical protein
MPNNIHDVEKAIKFHLKEIERLSRHSIFLATIISNENKQKSTKPVKRIGAN